MKAYEGGTGKDKNDFDVDYYALKPEFKFGSAKITPTLTYIYSKNASAWAPLSGNKEVKVWMAGADVDVKMGAGSFWFTGIYEGGDVELLAPRRSRSTWRHICWPAAGRSIWDPRTFTARYSMPPGMTRRRSDYEQFFIPKVGHGQSYYWAEIMGFGIFDNQASTDPPRTRSATSWRPTSASGSRYRTS